MSVQIEEKLELIKKLLRECEEIAEDSDINFIAILDVEEPETTHNYYSWTQSSYGC